MAKISEALTYGLTIRESATDGSDFTNPATDYRRLFLGEDGQLHVKDSSGTVTDIGVAGTDVATDAIWTTAGKVAVATGTATATEQWPPGHVFDYAEKTSRTTVTASSEATADTVVTGNAVAYDGSTVVLIECYSEWIAADNVAAGRDITVVLYDGSSSIGQLALARSQVVSIFNPVPIRAARRLTPSNATHTYSIRAYVSAGTGYVEGDVGDSGKPMPAFIRITKV